MHDEILLSCEIDYGICYPLSTLPATLLVFKNFTYVRWTSVNGL